MDALATAQNEHKEHPTCQIPGIRTLRKTDVATVMLPP